MMFRRALYLSIAAHLLIFSSAIAVAHHAGGIFLSSPQVIQVSLISTSPGPRGGAGTIRQSGIRPRAVALQPVEVMSEPKRAAPRELPAELSSAAELPEAAHTAVMGIFSDDDGNDVYGQTIASAGAGQGEDARTGFIAPQQWAVIQAAIERTKNYPRLARERGIEGVVRLRFRLNSTGSVEAVEVMKSSGYEILDTASVRAVYRAVPMPSVHGWVEVPIAYVLK